MRKKIYVSYVRGDADAERIALLEGLKRYRPDLAFAGEALPYSQSSELGQRIRREMDDAAMVLFLIGPTWHVEFIRDSGTTVGVEMAIALGSGLSILTVLLGDTPYPGATGLSPIVQGVLSLRSCRYHPALGATGLGDVLHAIDAGLARSEQNAAPPRPLSKHVVVDDGDISERSAYETPARPAPMPAAPRAEPESEAFKGGGFEQIAIDEDEPVGVEAGRASSPVDFEQLKRQVEQVREDLSQDESRAREEFIKEAAAAAPSARVSDEERARREREAKEFVQRMRERAAKLQAERDAEYVRAINSPEGDVPPTVGAQPAPSAPPEMPPRAAPPPMPHAPAPAVLPPTLPHYPAPNHGPAPPWSQAGRDAEYHRIINSPEGDVPPTVPLEPPQQVIGAQAGYGPRAPSPPLNSPLSTRDMIGNLALAREEDRSTVLVGSERIVASARPSPRAAELRRADQDDRANTARYRRDDFPSSPPRPPAALGPSSEPMPPRAAAPRMPSPVSQMPVPSRSSSGGSGLAWLFAAAALVLLPLLSRTVRESLSQTAAALLAALGMKQNAITFFGLLKRKGAGEVHPQTDLVDCSVFAPPVAPPRATVMIQVFLHIPVHAERAKFQATVMDSTAMLKGAKTLQTPIARGARVAVGLDCMECELHGGRIDDPIQEVIWRGEPVFAQFLLRMPDTDSGYSLYPKIRISVDGGLIGFITFRLGIETEAAGSQSVALGECARRYNHAFLSYATADRKEVLKRAQVLKAAGVSFFQDILSLDPGVRWEKEIYRNIDTCDLFLLFWSEAARDSAWVIREAEYALSRRGTGDVPDIVPVILEGPPPVLPPPSLAAIHFNDKISYLVSAS